MTDYAKLQRLKARDERRTLIASNVTNEQFRLKAKSYPAGSVWVWAAQEVHGPIPAQGSKQNAA